MIEEILLVSTLHCTVLRESFLHFRLLSIFNVLLKLHFFYFMIVVQKHRQSHIASWLLQRSTHTDGRGTKGAQPENEENGS